MPWDKEKYKDLNIRKTDAKPLKHLLNKMFEQYRLTGKFREKRIVNSWEKIMGPSISKRTSNIFMKNDVLFVELTSAPLKNDLTLSKEKIIFLFDQEFGKNSLEDIRFL